MSVMGELSALCALPTPVRMSTCHYHYYSKVQLAHQSNRCPERWVKLSLEGTLWPLPQHQQLAMMEHSSRNDSTAHWTLKPFLAAGSPFWFEEVSDFLLTPGEGDGGPERSRMKASRLEKLDFKSDKGLAFGRSLRSVEGFSLRLEEGRREERPCWPLDDLCDTLVACGEERLYS